MGTWLFGFMGTKYSGNGNAGRTFHVLSNDAADIAVSDLDSNTSGMISAAFAVSKPSPLPAKIGFKLENRSASPIAVQGIVLDRSFE
jgi:hypothetical protein